MLKELNIANRHILSLLLIAALTLGVFTGVRPVAASGTLYVSPAVTPSMAAGSTFNINIQLANMDPFDGWDIRVQTDPTVISPQSLTITPNMLEANFSIPVTELVNCVNGAGVGCYQIEGPGIANSAAVRPSGCPPQSGPSSGLLFTITYKVIATSLSASSPIHIFNDFVVNTCTAAQPDHTTLDGFYGGGTIHGLSVTAVTPFPTSLSQGAIVTIGVTIKNTGNQVESSITVTALATGASVGTASIASLPVGASTRASVTWDTAPFAPATYTIAASATDASTTSSTFTDGTVTVIPLHDCRFVHGELLWTHHLSLTKNPSGQTFTTHILCDLISTEFVLVTVRGSSAAGLWGAGSIVTQLQSGVVTDIVFSQAVPDSFIGTKICFTASVSWGPTLVTTNLSPGHESGCFGVAP